MPDAGWGAGRPPRSTLLSRHFPAWPGLRGGLCTPCLFGLWSPNGAHCPGLLVGPCRLPAGPLHWGPATGHMVSGEGQTLHRCHARPGIMGSVLPLEGLWPAGWSPGLRTPQQTEGFRKRWFTMDDRRLMYFKDPLDAFARGEVFIGSKESGYTVLQGLPPSTQGHHWPHGITIVTPDRKFLFTCETEAEQREWVEAFQRVVDRPMLPQEYAVEAHFKHKP
uniref:PH domain-containing protein n=1 Tax=Castor canadensis TaxID=51338 RepID=A0A8C0VZI1_CASCN